MKNFMKKKDCSFPCGILSVIKESVGMKKTATDGSLALSIKYLKCVFKKEDNERQEGRGSVVLSTAAYVCRIREERKSKLT
ncbi:hypothetical protein DCC39_00550 [Pueribacillus theae]|uniref:Uncharacterized protein n=1 Tax=Pueribacillus theae TaxID=2171751 RepID=A0A2U1K7B4_9BACI|nr:hypothetical protein DCC39_00550 [Pueribacillus theae]